jgi:hypothetical protein
MQGYHRPSIDIVPLANHDFQFKDLILPPHENEINPPG